MATTPSQRRGRASVDAPTCQDFTNMPHDVLSLWFDELDAPDLGRLACVSRDFRDAIDTPTTWRRQASKSLSVDGEWMRGARPTHRAPRLPTTY
jgi:hypothetical protein